MEAWLDDMNTRFAANRYGLIDDADFRAVFSGLAAVFADWRHLSVKRVKGATYPVPFTDNLGLVAPAYRILGMQAVALNGTDSGSAGAGAVAPPVYYTLLRFNGGDVDALLDTEPGTTLTVKAHWVRTSGTDEEKVASFPVLPLEDVNVYKGEVYQYSFTNVVPNVTRLLEIVDDITDYAHPVPTGLDDDPHYKPFAPLQAASSYDDTALRAELADLGDRAHTLEADLVALENEQLRLDATQQLHGGWLGNLGNLLTTYKGNLVGALNELLGKVAVNTGNITANTNALATHTTQLNANTALLRSAVDYAGEVTLAGNVVQGGENRSRAYALASGADVELFDLSNVAPDNSVFGRCTFFRALGPGPATVSSARLDGAARVLTLQAGEGLLVRAASPAVGYTAQWRTGSGTGSAAAGGLDYANPVAVNGTTTLQANKAHYVSGAGYALALPDAAANLGAAVFVQVAASASGLFPLTGTAYTLYARESLLLRATADGWVKTAGELLPMSARLETVTNQQDALPSGVETKIPFSALARLAGPAALASTATASFVVQRPGTATMSAVVVIKNAAPNGLYYVTINLTRNGTTTPLIGVYAVAESTNQFGVAAPSINAPVQAGDVLDVRFYTVLGGLNLLGTTPCVFTFSELV